MGKVPHKSSQLNGNRKPNANAKKKKQKRIHQTATAVSEFPDDAYSFNQTTVSRNGKGNGFNHGSYLTFTVSDFSKSELVQLRKRLANELNAIRELRDRINSGRISAQGKLSKSKNMSNLFGFDHDSNRLSSSNYGDNEGLLNECKAILTKLMKQKISRDFKTPVDAVKWGLHDYHQIVKRPMDLGTVKSNFAKNLYSNPVEFASDVRLTFNNALLYNPKNDPVHEMAAQLLARFEEMFRPVQVKVDSAGQTRKRELHEFDDGFDVQGNEDLQGSSWNNGGPNFTVSGRVKKPKPKPRPKPKESAVLEPEIPRKTEEMQMQSHSSASTHSNHLPLPVNQPIKEQTPSPVRAPRPAREQKIGKVGSTRLPKPRAKDPNKRDMSIEEKQKLGLGLQDLPQEKMPQLVQIIRKRNEHMVHDGDEIELDIEALDTETLWELDRFVTNWKKMVSKTKRQALMMNNNPGAAQAAGPSSSIIDTDMDATSEKNDMGNRAEKNEDEDVDIDDDMLVESFPTVEIEKDEGGGSGGVLDHQGHTQGNASSSSSSSSSDSSSSDSDSGSSSGSDSDAAQS